MRAVVLLLLLLAGCGKKGAPVAPGPADKITYPHSYPSSLSAPGRTIPGGTSLARMVRLPQDDAAAYWIKAVQLDLQ